MPVKQMMKMSGFIPRRRLRGLTPETATRPHGDGDHQRVADIVARGEERGDEYDHPDELRARVQAVDDGVPGEILAEGDVLQHPATPFASASSAARSWSSV